MVGIVGPIGTQELVIILIIALVIFGPKRLPELGRSLGKGIREFKKSTNELTEHITEEDQGKAKVEEAAAAPEGKEDDGKVAAAESGPREAETS